MAEISREDLLDELGKSVAVLQGQYDDGSQPTHPSDVAIATAEVKRISELLELDITEYILSGTDPRDFGKITNPSAQEEVEF